MFEQAFDRIFNGTHGSISLLDFINDVTGTLPAEVVEIVDRGLFNSKSPPSKIMPANRRSLQKVNIHFLEIPNRNSAIIGGNGRADQCELSLNLSIASSAWIKYVFTIFQILVLGSGNSGKSTILKVNHSTSSPSSVVVVDLFG